MAASGIRIDRLTLELPAGSAEEGKRLALQIASALAAAGGMPAAGDVPVLRVELPADAARPPGLAARIVAEALRQLRRETG